MTRITKLPPPNKNMTVRKGSLIPALLILGLGVVLAAEIIVGSFR